MDTEAPAPPNRRRRPAHHRDARPRARRGRCRRRRTCPSEPVAHVRRGPARRPPDADGVYLWHTSHGWHLRVNDPGADRAVFTGSVRVDGRIVSIGRHLENAGRRRRLPVDAPVSSGFRFVNFGGVDGLDFVTRCASTVSVRVKVDGTTVGADHVFIGADGHHPDAVPPRWHALARRAAPTPRRMPRRPVPPDRARRGTVASVALRSADAHPHHRRGTRHRSGHRGGAHRTRARRRRHRTRPEAPRVADLEGGRPSRARRHRRRIGPGLPRPRSASSTRW